MDKITINAYNNIVNEYDSETIDFWKRFPAAFIEKFTRLSEGKIIDVGSGTGRDGLIFQQTGKDVVCVDASEEMVRLSSERGLTSVLANFDELPFEDESFNGVWSYTALLHVPKNEVGASLSEIYRVLKPGGVFALGLIEGDSEGYKLEDGWSRWFSYYQADEVEKLCGAHGFAKIDLDIFKPGSRNYLNFIFKKVSH